MSPATAKTKPDWNEEHELHPFDGGLRLREHKAMSTASPIVTLPAPDKLVIPVLQHIGKAGEVLVSVGERVLKGQMLARPKHVISAAIHAPVSGVITDISDYPVPHPSGLPAQCIVIENDHREEWVARKPVGDDFHHMNSHSLRNIVRDAGIVGLGGAAFPSAVKQTEMDIATLIINGVECEPYITCDDMLMRERAMEVLTGADIIGHIIKARECIIAIEDNKPEAIAAMQAAVDEDGTGYFRVQAVPTKYPSGGEKQLIKMLTGREVPINGLPADIDLLVHNVGTACAVYNAIYRGEPLISRIVTVTGHGVKQPQNLEVLIGTAMHECVAAAGGYNDQVEQLIVGGPMMGFTVPDDSLPVTKAGNCLLVTARGETHPASQQQHSPCIRCGLCVEVCPARLLPQQLYWYASSQNIDRLLEHDLFDCIECGCCAYVCPSSIPLVQYYRFAKSEIWARDEERKQADRARLRHERREARLQRQKLEREQRMRKKREALKQKQAGKAGETDAKQDAIAAALARVQAKKQQRNIQPRNTDNLTAEQAALIAAVDKRRQQLNRQAGGGSGESQGDS